MLDWKNAYRLILSILNRTRISRTQGCSSCCMTGQTKRETRVQGHVQRTWENFYQLFNVYDLSQVHGNKSLSLSSSTFVLIRNSKPKSHCNMLRWPIPFPLAMSPLLPLLSHMKDLLWINFSASISKRRKKKNIVKANEV